jgi:hypothetical protein
LNKPVGDLWLVISLIRDVQLLGSLLLGCSVLQLLKSLLVHSKLQPHSGHLLLALIIQSVKNGLLSLSGGRSALQTKIMIKYIRWSSKVIMNEEMQIKIK